MKRYESVDEADPTGRVTQGLTQGCQSDTFYTLIWLFDIHSGLLNTPEVVNCNVPNCVYLDIIFIC